MVRDGSNELLASYGMANLEWKVPATVNTAYQLASATKPLAGTAVMLLVQEGRIALDSSVTRYLPEAPSEWAPITLRHLLSHTSGLPAWRPIYIDAVGPKGYLSAISFVSVRAWSKFPLISRTRAP